MAKRALRDVAWILRQRESYLAILRALYVLRRPLRTILSEVRGGPLASREVTVRTPIGDLAISLFHEVDLSTVFGVFCRDDYAIEDTDRVVVDIGANIGVASLFFLSRDPRVVVYAYEPVPENVARLRQNVARFGDRCVVVPRAVDVEAGVVQMATEPTGKFGHIAAGAGLRVQAEGVNAVIERVLAERGRIDCLKIDVEGHELPLVSAIRPESWRFIRRVYAESCDSTAHLPLGVVRTYRYNVERLENLGARPASAAREPQG